MSESGTASRYLTMLQSNSSLGKSDFDVLMTRMRKTSSASLIAREQVAVAVGSPCGVYQYLVCSGQEVVKRRLEK